MLHCVLNLHRLGFWVDRSHTCRQANVTARDANYTGDCIMTSGPRERSLPSLSLTFGVNDTSYINSIDGAVIISL